MMIPGIRNASNAGMILVPILVTWLTLEVGSRTPGLEWPFASGCTVLMLGLNPGPRENYHLGSAGWYHPGYLDPDSSQTIYNADKLDNLQDFNFNKNQERIKGIICQRPWYFATMSKDVMEID